MTTQDLTDSLSLGDYAHQAIHHSVKRFVKPKATVLDDTDPEVLHKMRTGMRRLRTAVQVFESVLKFPKLISDRRLRNIARGLGAVRDWDVLQSILETRYRPQLPPGEQQTLETVLNHLQHQRQHDFDAMTKMLISSDYRKVVRSLKRWIDYPCYRPIADYRLLEVASDLALPFVSQLLLHPGWLVGLNLLHHPLTSDPKAATLELNHLLTEKGTTLHSLRKQIKRVRYQAELFAPCYGPEYRTQIEAFQTAQDILGQLQDSLVLQDFLRDRLSQPLDVCLPTLALTLKQEQLQAWSAWQPLQRQYLDPTFRHQLYQLFLSTRLPDHAQTC
jgi:CHAD domain-containing protein